MQFLSLLFGHFFILGTRAEDFWQCNETFFCGGANILRANFMMYKIILLQKILDEVIDQRLKGKLTDIWK